MKSLLVVGTDTNVGKTVVTALLALHFQSRGKSCGVMKPFASGCLEVVGAGLRACIGEAELEAELISEDAVFLRDMTGAANDLDLINPVRLAEPLTPLNAARRAGIPTEQFVPRARAAFDELQTRHEIVVVEGVGGLLAPIAQRDGRILTNRDLAEEWNLPVVLVARRTLGTINHTLLTIEALRGHTEIAGLVFCDAEPVAENDIAAQTSPALIEEISGVAVWGCVPFLAELSPGAFRGGAVRYLTALTAWNTE